MKQKKQFIKPEILRELGLLGDGPILAESIVNDAQVLSMGQEVHDLDASSDDVPWNKQWEW